jgi:quercetin dioxygenase-like cupin family protein
LTLAQLEWTGADSGGSVSQTQPSRGRELRVGPARLEIKVDPKATQSRVFAYESTLPPGAGMPYLHLHREMEEIFYVLEGTIEYTRGEDTILGTTGAVVQVPAGIAHRFRNQGDIHARHLALITPGLAGIRVMEDVAEVDFSDAHAVAEVLRRHDSELVAQNPLIKEQGTRR